MARRLDTQFASDTAQQPIKKGTLDFLQDSHKIDLNQLIGALTGDPIGFSGAYVLYGCLNTGSGNNYIIGQGAVWVNGEVFEVASTSFTTIGSQVPVYQIVNTQYTTNADPTLFTDGITRQVHNIRTLQVGPGASGSGLRDYSASIFGRFWIARMVGDEANRAVAAEGGLDARITALEGAWQSDTDAGHWSGGGITSVVPLVYYLKYGTTLKLIIRVSFTAGSTSGFSYTLPNSIATRVLDSGTQYFPWAGISSGVTVDGGIVSMAMSGGSIVFTFKRNGGSNWPSGPATVCCSFDINID